MYFYNERSRGILWQNAVENSPIHFLLKDLHGKNPITRLVRTCCVCCLVCVSNVSKTVLRSEVEYVFLTYCSGLVLHNIHITPYVRDSCLSYL